MFVGKLISNNKLRFPNVYLQFIAILQAADLSAILHVKTFNRTDRANISNDISVVVNVLKKSCCVFCIFHLHL